MRKFGTSYLVNSNKYGSHIYARSLKEAERLALIRNIGEKVIGAVFDTREGYGRKIPEELQNPYFRDLTDYDFVKKLPDIIHTACFLSYIASHSSPNFSNALSDEGIVHELVHLMVCEDTDTRMVRRIRGRFCQLQDQVVGYLPISNK